LAFPTLRSLKQRVGLKQAVLAGQVSAESLQEEDAALQQAERDFEARKAEFEAKREADLTTISQLVGWLTDDVMRIPTLMVGAHGYFRDDDIDGVAAAHLAIVGEGEEVGTDALAEVRGMLDVLFENYPPRGP
jgi:hypothetical protein